MECDTRDVLSINGLVVDGVFSSGLAVKKKGYSQGTEIVYRAKKQHNFAPERYKKCIQLNFCILSLNSA